MSKLLTLHPKAGAAGVAGAVILLVLHGLAYYHVVLGGEVQAAIAVLAAFAASYLAPAPEAPAAPAPAVPPPA